MMTDWRAMKVGGMLLASAALAPLVVGAQAPVVGVSRAAATNTVARVQVARSGQATSVEVNSSGTIPLTYHVLRLSNPPRVVLDFDDTQLGMAQNSVPSSFDPVEGVRLGQFQPDKARVVIDLARASKFSVDQNGSSLVVNFTDPSAPATASAPTVPPVAPRHSFEVVAIPASLTKPAPRPEAYPLPVSLTQNAVALASPNPQVLASSATPAPVSATSTPAAAASVSTAMVSPQAGTAAPQGTPAAQAPHYSGEPISVNLKDVDLRDFFRLIHEISGLNVVLDPSVHGTVTLVLDEVPWDQALDIVLQNNSLSKELDGNVLRIVTQDTLKKEADDRRDLARAQSEAVDTVTTTRVLSYAKASELVTPLKRFISSRGDVMAIDRSNTLIIRDIPSALPQIDNLIRQLDRRSQQVEIEARVVQASRSFARDIGTQFGVTGAFNGPNSANVLGGNPLSSNSSPIDRSNLPANLQPPLVTTGSSSIPLLSNFPANAPSSSLIFAHASPNFALDFIITAAESKGVGKLLSSPQLVTQNNAQAEVKQGQQIPIQTTVNNTISVQYVDAVLRLQVTPQITADGTIFMDVTVENTQIDNGIPLVNGVPALDTQSAQTKVLINDGGTVVIGGVMVSTQQTNVFQVPLLGSVPLIGHLFKRNEVNVSSQELLFFLTPRILPG
jgi:type IV pilus assembly protein PilQ